MPELDRCPHSTVPGASRRSCSLCIGATPRLCTRDEATGQLFIDGKPIDREFALNPTQCAPLGRRGRPKKGVTLNDPDDAN
jgi:hypothetical protein